MNLSHPSRPLRRTLLQFTGALGVLGTVAAAGLLKTTQAVAAVWNKAGFESKAVADAMKSLGASGAAESRDIVVPMRPEPKTFNAQTYLRHGALPNFFFHTTTAYDILRHNGVEIGKRDFLGVY